MKKEQSFFWFHSAFRSHELGTPISDPSNRQKRAFNLTIIQRLSGGYPQTEFDTIIVSIGLHYLISLINNTENLFSEEKDSWSKNLMARLNISSFSMIRVVTEEIDEIHLASLVYKWKY